MIASTLPRKVKLLVSDVDGTLLTPEKLITPRSKASVDRLRENGILFTLASSRPVQGLKRIANELGIRVPIGALNGGVLISPKFEIIRTTVLSRTVAEQALRIFRTCGLMPWIYTAIDWLVENPGEPRARQEAIEIGFDPKASSNLSSRLEEAVKIVGVSVGSDLKSAACEELLRRQLGQRASINRSHSDFLDVTHPEATKGSVICFLSAQLGISTNEIVSIGDMPNDVPMFERSGIGIAMGNASAEVKSRANFVTMSNAENGFAAAIDVLNRGNAVRVRGKRQLAGNHPTLSRGGNFRGSDVLPSPTTRSRQFVKKR